MEIQLTPSAVEFIKSELFKKSKNFGARIYITGIG
jgi:Fe-S cluster assembly iron-binding protein IscA